MWRSQAGFTVWLAKKEQVATIDKQDKVNSYATKCIQAVPVWLKFCIRYFT